VVICLDRGADLHMAQLMPLPLTVSCFSKIQIGFVFLVPAHPGSPGQRAVKRVCVCVCAAVSDATCVMPALRRYDAALLMCVYATFTCPIGNISTAIMQNLCPLPDHLPLPGIHDHGHLILYLTLTLPCTPNARLHPIPKS